MPDYEAMFAPEGVAGHPWYNPLTGRDYGSTRDAGSSGVTEVPKGGKPTTIQPRLNYRALFAPKAVASVNQQPAASTVADMAKSFGTGVEGSVASIAGAPGDMREMLAAIYEKFTGKNLPTIPGYLKAAIPVLRSTADYMKPLEKAGLTHTPQTTAGQYAKTIGEFAPAAIGGEEALLGRIGRYVVAPAVASETAGQVTKGTSLEPVARAVAGLTGSGLTGAARNLAAERAATKVLPTTEELAASSKNAYKQAKDAGVVVTSDSFDKMVTAMKSEMSTEGYHPARHPKAASELKILEAEKGQPKTLDHLDILRQVVKDNLKSPEASERRMAMIMKGHIDEYLDNLTPADVHSVGHPLVAVNSLQEARSIWQRKSKSELLDSVFERAKDTAGQYSVSGKENALRKEFRQLSRNKRLMRTFTKEEQTALRKVGRGGPVENVLRWAGKFAPTGVVPALVAGGAAATFGGPAGVAVAGTGLAARAAATALARRNADRVRQLMVAGKLPAKPPASPVSAALSANASSLAARKQLLDLMGVDGGQ